MNFDLIKFEISPELISFIKALREKYNVKATDIKEKIGKSSAYISKFDKGDYKLITLKDFLTMIEAICNEKDLSFKLVDEYVKQRISSDKSEYSSDHGLSTYDDVIRIVTVPEKLIDFINDQLNNIYSKESFETHTLQAFIEKINENSDLPDISKSDKYEYNIYYADLEDSDGCKVDNGGCEECDQKGTCIKNNSAFVKVKLKFEEVSKLLAKEVAESNCLTITALLYQIFRENGINKNLAQICAANTMSQYGFYSLQAQKFAKITAEKRNKANSQLIEMSNQTQFVISNLIDFIYFMNKKNSSYVVKKMLGLNNNLYSDPSIIFAILDLPFSKTKDLSREQKGKMIQEISDIIIKYSDVKEDNNKYQIIE